LRFPRWRKATWALVIWCALILIWAIAGGASNNCGSQPTHLDKSACQAGTGIGVAIILLIGFFGFIFFSLIWLMSRPKNRSCPRCGEDVKKGVMVCKSCGFDFNTIATGQPSQTPSPQQISVPAADR
jgi:hypothetical protein